MRVLMINSGSGVRSTGRICTDIATELIKEGHEVRIGYARGNVPEVYRDISIRIGNSLDVYFDAFCVRVFDNEGFGNKRATKEFIKWIKDFNPDIIHLHNLHGYYINIEILFRYLKEANIPVIWTLHDCWSFTGHCAYFDSVNCNKWKSQCNKCPLQHEYPASYVFDNSNKNFKKKKELFTSIDRLTLVTPSYWLSDLIKESYFENKRVVVIHNGINTDVFRPTTSDIKRKLEIEGKIMILGVAAIWNRRKGLDEFYKLRKLLPLNKYAIVLIGLSEKQMKNLPQGVIGIRNTESVTELVQFYSAADCFVNPTFEDNYPTTNIEALSCGTPVLTYDSGGSSESVLPDCVVSKGDVNSLANLILNNKYNCNTGFDCTKKGMISKYLQCYNSLLPSNAI